MTTTYEALLHRARELADSGGRRLLGITGAPGAGKSTLAERLAVDLGADAVVVPMDGFHLAARQLVAQGLADVKGAPQTFDDAGYAALLRRLVDQREGEVVYAPAFERDLEEPIAGAIRVEASVALVITEGNYLLAETGAWPLASACLDETWFLDLDPQVRLARLIARHERFGKSPEAARRWAEENDERNAQLIEATAERADARLLLA